MARPRGFTLIEMVLYVTLFAITTGVLVSVYANNLATDRLARREQDLNETRQLVTTRIRDLIVSANQVVSPASGSSATLTLDGAGITDGPVTLSVSAGTLYVDTASAEPAAISAPDIVVSDFLATRGSGSPPSVEVTMTLTANAGTVDVSDTFSVFSTLRYE